MKEEFNTELTRTTEEKGKKKRTGRLLGWLVLALAVIVIVPVGIVMFIISGIWSAADKMMGNRAGS